MTLVDIKKAYNLMVRDIKNENRLINVKKMNFNIFKDIQPFSLIKKKKIIFFQKEMNFLTNYHYKHSKNYKILLSYSDHFSSGIFIKTIKKDNLFCKRFEKIS